MNNEELLENLKAKYETILSEDANISKKIEELSKEKDELPSTNKIKKLEEIESILKNGKSFKGKLKSFFALPYNGGPFNALHKIIIYAIFLCALAFIYSLTFMGVSIHHNIVINIFVYFLDTLITVGAFAFPIADIVYINKINKKYKLEEVSSELDETKKRKEEITKNLELQEKLHQTKQIKLSELQTTMQNVIEVMNISFQEDSYDSTEKEKEKKLVLKRNNGKLTSIKY